MNTFTKNSAKNEVYDLIKKAIILILTLGMSLTVSAEPPDPCDTPLIFADMEEDAGWGVFSGGDITGGFRLAEEGSVAPLNGGTWAAFFDVNASGTGGFGGIFRTFPVDLTGMTHFNFWINPAAGQNYFIEINLQEDDNNDNDVSFANPADDDEFRYNLHVAPLVTGAKVLSGGGWQLVSIPLADFYDNNAHFQGNDVFDPFLSGNGQLINVVFAVSLPAGAGANFITDNWFFSCEDGLCSSLKTLSKNISDKSNGAGYPAGAANDIAAALGDLDAAVADCERNDVQEAYKDLEDAMNELMDAAEDGADVSEEIASLIALVESDVTLLLQAVSGSIGYPQVAAYIDKANNFIADADLQISEGDFNLAIRRLASARKDLQRAALFIEVTSQGGDVADYVADARDDLQGLITNGGFGSNANADLQDAVDVLSDAVFHLYDGEIRDAIEDLRDAVEALQDAEDDGATATAEINAIVDVARLLAEMQINEAQAYASNPQTDARLAKAQKDMSDAADEIADGRPERAIKEYRDAWVDAKVALEHGLGLRKVEDGTVASATPETFSLAQNYPNPFNPSTTIAFQIADPAFVELKVYDISGRLVKTLVNENRSAGNYTEQWDGKNSIGQKVGSGIYFYQITAGTFQQIKKMMLVK